MACILAQDVSPLLLSEGGLQEASWARQLLAESLLDSTSAWGPECVSEQLRAVATPVVELLQGAVEGSSAHARRGAAAGHCGGVSMIPPHQSRTGATHTEENDSTPTAAVATPVVDLLQGTVEGWEVVKEA
eukprot:1145203-Pelagomonas_calceolata.AAC.4